MAAIRGHRPAHRTAEHRGGGGRRSPAYSGPPSGNVYLCSYFQDLELDRAGGRSSIPLGKGRKDPVAELAGGTRRLPLVIRDEGDDHPLADLRGFTRYSEKHTAEEVVSMLNEYLAEMTDIVLRWEGTLDKFIGDAIVAFRGAPLAQDNHAELALRCSLNMIRRMEEMRVR